MNRILAVSVIIPVYNEAGHIREFLEHLEAQDFPPERMEVIISDGMSSDGTRAILEELIASAALPFPVRLIDNPERTVPFGLNHAIREAKNEIIVRMDVHARFEPDYISQCVRLLKETGAENVGGPTAALAEGYIARAVAAAYNSPFSVGGSPFHNLEYEGYADTVTFGCWKKEYLERIGMFDEEFVRNQDDELNLRTMINGGRIFQSPAIKSYYFPRDSISRLFKQQLQYGYYKVRVIQKHKRPASIRHLVPIAFVAGLIAGAVASAFSTTVLYLYLGVLGVYVLLSLYFALAAARKKGLDLLPGIPVIFFVYHVSYGAGFALGILDFYLLNRRIGKHLGKALTSVSR